MCRDASDIHDDVDVQQDSSTVVPRPRASQLWLLTLFTILMARGRKGDGKHLLGREKMRKAAADARSLKDDDGDRRAHVAEDPLASGAAVVVTNQEEGARGERRAPVAAASTGDASKSLAEKSEGQDEDARGERKAPVAAASTGNVSETSVEKNESGTLGRGSSSGGVAVAHD